MMWSTGYDRLSSAKDKDNASELDTISDTGSVASYGLITELNVCDFAHQIASGLQHLESMNVSYTRHLSLSLSL